uniref:Uncharacterized protein n=1 Tax=Arundo donax TaxID=35708 RepID=A0A0A8XRB5_ARUDO
MHFSSNEQHLWLSLMRMCYFFLANGRGQGIWVEFSSCLQLEFLDLRRAPMPFWSHLVMRFIA